MLIDDVEITIKAGNGGNGSVHFLRNAQTRKGGPDGGNGGNGGNIYLQGVDDILGLSQFQFKKEWKAEDGIAGSKKNLYGRNGKDLIITIPLGTTITDTKTGEQWEILNKNDNFCITQGGKGGKGNKEFATAINKAPRYAEKGEPGQERNLHLVLRIIADIGLIGLPNAGKSSLLKTLTNAKPKIGNYAFTTLEPNLGVLENNVIARRNDESIPTGSPRSLSVARDDVKHIILADLPGLIEGAAKGKGLGIQFLKHIEKTNKLIHCIDSTSEEAIKDYQTVRHELELYSKKLPEKEEIILLTKTDLIDKISLEEKIKGLQKLGKKILTVSVYNEEMLQNLRNVLQD